MIQPFTPLRGPAHTLLTLLTGQRLPMDWRVLLPGYADDLAFDRGLIETPDARTGSQARDREQFRIRPGTDLAIDARSWSAQIRRETR